VLPDLYVVRDLDEIINLGALTNHSAPETSPVDARVRADLNIVLQNNNADLRHLLLPPIDKFKTKSIRSNYRIRLKNNSLAQHAALANRSIHMDHTVLPYLNIPSDDRARTDDSPTADRSPFPNDSPSRNNNRSRVEIYPIRYHRPCSHSRLHGTRLLLKMINHLGKRCRGILNLYQQTSVGRREVPPWDKDKTSPRRRKLRSITQISEKAHFPGFSLIERINPREYLPRVALDLASDNSREFSRCESHKNEELLFLLVDLLQERVRQISHVTGMQHKRNPLITVAGLVENIIVVPRFCPVRDHSLNLF